MNTMLETITRPNDRVEMLVTFQGLQKWIDCDVIGCHGWVLDRDGKPWLKVSVFPIGFANSQPIMVSNEQLRTVE